MIDFIKLKRLFCGLGTRGISTFSQLLDGSRMIRQRCESISFFLLLQNIYLSPRFIQLTYPQIHSTTSALWIQWSPRVVATSWQSQVFLLFRKIPNLTAIPCSASGADSGLGGVRTECKCSKSSICEMHYKSTNRQRISAGGRRKSSSLTSLRTRVCFVIVIRCHAALVNRCSVTKAQTHLHPQHD